MTNPAPVTPFDQHPVTQAPIREAVALFMTTENLQAAIRDLEGTEFPRQDISVMGSEADLEKVFGAKTVPPEFAMDNSDTPRNAPSRPEEQTIGMGAVIGGGTYLGAMALALAAGALTFPAIVGAAIIGGIGGGAIGAALTKVMGDKYNKNIEEQIQKGGLLLWVRTPDAEKERLATEIMVKHDGQHVHVHDIA